MPSLPRLASCVLAAVILAAVLHAGYYLAQVVVLEARGAVGSDGRLFLILARGILNGLHPYSDLFESKPPGMFLLFALSLITTGDDRPAILLQVSIFIAIPLLLLAFAHKELRQAGQGTSRILVIAVALLLGLLLALYLEERSGSFQTESFGAFFASAYLLHVFARRDASCKQAMLANAALLLATFGLKEPFLLTTLAGVLLIARDRRHFMIAFVIPFAIAFVLGIGVLAAFGYLGPYLSVYLPAMLTARIDANPLEPLWIRAFAVGRLFANVTEFYTAPLFGAILAVLWLLAPALGRSERSSATLLLTLVTSAAAYFFLLNTRILLEVLRAMTLLHVSLSGAGGFIAVRIVAYLLLGLLLFVLLLREHRRGLATGTIVGSAALCLTAVSVGVAEYAIHHWGFAFPVIFALVLLFIRYAAHEPPWSIPVVAVTLVTVATASLYRPNEDHLRFLRLQLSIHSRAASHSLAPRFDRLLDRCAITSYFAWDSATYAELALARHSPLGPVFALHEHTNYLPQDHPLLQQTYANIRDKAQLIVMGTGSTPDDIIPGLGGDFTRQTPPCAVGSLPLDDLTLYFAKK